MIASTLGILFFLLFLGLPVAAVMLILALGVSALFSSMPLYVAAGELSWVSSSNYLLVSVPFFILLGEILLRAGITDRLYETIADWIGWLPGGLMHANIGACTAFAATSGSSVATAATISVVGKPMVDKYGYNERLFYGSIAAGGTLGILIPPSINLILYGWLTNTSVPSLYMAGFIPGFILAGLFSLTIMMLCLFRPSLGGISVSASWTARFRSLSGSLPPLFIFVVVIGSIYAGIATPTESAALGVTAALILAAFYRRLNMAMLTQAIDGTMRTTGMIMLIVMAAWFLNFVLSALGLVTAVNAAIVSMKLAPFALLMAIILVYAVKPGVFDLDDIDLFSTPAVSFFLGLPGPRHPKQAFDVMVAAARKLSQELNGELKDDQRSVLTAQTIEHYRQRIVEFERRALTQKR